MTDNQKDELGKEDGILTNRQGHPITDNQNTRTVGEGPTVLENYNFLERSPFDRERIPERRSCASRRSWLLGLWYDRRRTCKQIHACQAPTNRQNHAYGSFSTVIHGGHSPETFATRVVLLQSFTEDGNWDLVGNNLRSFLSRIKFPVSFTPSSQTQSLTVRTPTAYLILLAIRLNNAYDYVAIQSLEFLRATDGRAQV